MVSTVMSGTCDNREASGDSCGIAAVEISGAGARGRRRLPRRERVAANRGDLALGERDAIDADVAQPRMDGGRRLVLRAADEEAIRGRAVWCTICAAFTATSAAWAALTPSR